MIGSIRDMMMFMLYLVLAGLILGNYTAFNSILDTALSNWRKTLLILQKGASPNA